MASSASKLRGLSTLEVKPQPGGPLNGRAQVPAEFSRVAFQPTTTPVDTSVTPVWDAGAGDQLQQLTRALAAVNPALERAIDTGVAAEEREQAARALAEFEAMSPEAARKATEDGTLSAWENPYFRAAWKKLHGQSLGYEYQRDLQRAYDTGFDKRTGDIGQFVADQTRTFLEQAGNDTLILAGANSIIPQVNERLRTTHWDAVSKEVAVEARDNLFTKLDGMVTSGLAEGKTPAELVAAINAHTNDVRDTLSIAPREMDDIRMELATKYALAGNLDLVREILTKERNGVPPLSSIGSRVVGVQKLLEVAEDKQREVSRTQNYDDYALMVHDAQNGRLDDVRVRAAVDRGFITPGEASSLTASNLGARQQAVEAEEKRRQAQALEDAFQGQFAYARREGARMLMEGTIKGAGVFNYRTKDGGDASWSRDKFEDEATQEYLKVSEGYARRSGETPEDTFNREAAVFIRAAVANPKWKELLRSGPAAASFASFDPSKPSDPTKPGAGLPPVLAEGYALFKRLNAVSPTFLEQHLPEGDKARSFYESMLFAESAGSTPEQAYAQALRIASQPDLVKSQPFDFAPQDLKNALGDLGADTQIAATLIRDYGRFYMANGKSKSDALDLAVERLKATHTLVRGNLIPVNRRGQPDNLGDMLNGYVDTFARDHAKELGLDEDDITVMPAGNATDTFILVYAGNGAPVLLQGAKVTTGELVAWQKARDDETRAKALKDAEEAVNHRFDPWFDNGIFSAGPFVNGNEEAKAVGEVRDKAREEQRQRLDALRGRFGTYSDRNGR